MKIKIKDKNGVKLLTKEKYVTEDIEVAVDESLLGGVSIPSVTDLTCDSEGNVSWTAPNFDDLADYEPIISYVVSVNDKELETGTTNLNVYRYLKNGTNFISVKVKVFYNKEVSENVIYSKPIYEFITLTKSLPNKMFKSAAAAVGTNIYLFGGTDLTNYYNTILKFDTTTETLTTLEVTLEYNCHSINAIVYNNLIYLINYQDSNGFKKASFIFDTLTETLEKIIFDGSYEPNVNPCVLVNNIIYQFYSGGVVYMYNISTRKVTSDFVTSNAFTEAVLVNENIYLFTRNSIVKYDIESKIFTTLDITISNMSGTKAKKYGTDIYLFGGGSQTKAIRNTILKFDTLTETIETLEVTLPYIVWFTSIEIIENVIYIFGGKTDTIYLDEISKFAINT